MVSTPRACFNELFPTHTERGRVLKRFWSQVKIGWGDACWLWDGAKGPDGYGAFLMRKSPELRGSKAWHSMLAHRVAFLLEYGLIPADLYVCHKCDVRMCVRPDHLFLGTQLDNMADSVAKGRRPKGTQIHTNVLTEHDVLAIRREYRTGRTTQLALSRKFGVDLSHISGIVRGRYWRHVGGPRTHWQKEHAHAERRS